MGGLFTLWIFGSTLSLYSIIGLFLLLGIVKKNGIMVVDFALQRLDEGWGPREAFHEASIERFRPIMMTTLAALMGAVPLALGFGADGSPRRPLGLVIVGGTDFFPTHYALCHACHLPLAGMEALAGGPGDD
jgi:HAE1 family hydrophobic/amphiphilic exporter-1